MPLGEADEGSDSESAALMHGSATPSSPTALDGGRDRLSLVTKLRIGLGLALNSLPSNLVLSQGPYIFEAYYKSPAAMIGAAGTVMGFYNMANGVPIASWADRGTLNARLPSVFPMERWGRRAPWLVMGMPLNSLAALMVLFPPFPLGSEWLAAWYGLTLLVYFTGHTATTQQFYAIPQELCGSKKEVATLFAVIAPVAMVINLLSTSIPLLIYAKRPSIGGALTCCADAFTDCTVAPACGCYANATAGAAAGSVLSAEYAAVCPASAFDVAAAQEVACAQATDGQLGSVHLVAVLVAGLSFGQGIAVGPARGCRFRPTGMGGKKPLSFSEGVVTTLRCDSFRYLAACMFAEAAGRDIEAVFFSFFLVYSVGLDQTQMGRTLASVQMLLHTLPVLTIPVYRSLLLRGVARPWNITRWTRLFQVVLSPIFLLVNRNRLWPLYFAAVVFGISNGGESMSLEMMRGWTMDDDESRTGLRREGLLLSMNTVFQFFSTTVSLGLVAAFSVAGYEPDACPFDQSDATKATAKAVYILGPAACKFGYFCVMSKWPIQGQRLREMQAWTAKHGQAATAG